ncbi:MAG: leucine-rich repeat domain-containing protein [Tannerella sp.]|jgi:hypothetical protein|nr:leucine-rich repeat domain-containing protein [Tannerella sp.]
MDPVFEDSERLKKVIFPDTLKEISFSSFANCDLQEITLPERLESIESYAFAGNKNLKAVKIPKNVSSLCGSSFGDTNIEKFELDKDNPYFSEIDGVIFSKDKTKLIAFPSGSNVTSYIIPKNVKIIAYEAFCDSKVTNLVLPQTLESIESFAFESCYNLKSIEIPDCIKEMGSYVFRFCTALERVRLPNTITVLKESTFVGCSNLKELEIPASVKIIENGAVNGAHNLEKLTLHEGLEEINDDLCYTKIGKGFIPKTVRKILFGTPLFAHRYAFEYEIDRDNPYLCSLDSSVYRKDGTVMIYACKGKTNSFEVPNGVEKIEDYVFLWSKISKILLPESLKSIGHRCFDGCEELSEICLPASLVAMDFRAFDDCKNLEKMICLSTTPPEITNPSADCWKFMGDSKKLVLYVPKESLENYKTTKYWKDIKNILPL